MEDCRLKDSLPLGRCKADPYLSRLARPRKWTGHPSTTQLLKGTREAWLEITKDYYINPDDMAYAFAGTFSHAVLERFASSEGNLLEERLRDDICSGQFDFYSGKSGVLYDYKTWGSYKVQQALGIKQSFKWIPKKKDGKIMYTKGENGKSKVAFWDKKPSLVYDCEVTRTFGVLDTSIQLSDYRDKIRRILPEGYEVKKMGIQVICRESGLSVQRERGITEKAPLIPLNGISSVWVQRYMGRKRDLLLEALDKGYMSPCRRSSRWYPKEPHKPTFKEALTCLKCSKYCNVKPFCKEVGE
jgi:hypothetical protein